MNPLVHYVLPDGPERVHGECRPAIVVHYDNTDHVNLVVFRDGTHDTSDEVQRLIMWEVKVPHETNHHFRSWHFAEECHAHHAAQEATEATVASPYTPTVAPHYDPTSYTGGE